jgi:hypothetical protein
VSELAYAASLPPAGGGYATSTPRRGEGRTREGSAQSEYATLTGLIPTKRFAEVASLTGLRASPLRGGGQTRQGSARNCPPPRRGEGDNSDASRRLRTPFSKKGGRRSASYSKGFARLTQKSQDGLPRPWRDGYPRPSCNKRSESIFEYDF